MLTPGTVTTKWEVGVAKKKGILKVLVLEFKANNSLLGEVSILKRSAGSWSQSKTKNRKPTYSKLSVSLREVAKGSQEETVLKKFRG